MINLYMDVNVRGEITRQLREHGTDVLTSQEDGTRESSDSALLDRATDLNRVMVTCDVDLLSEAAMRQRSGGAFAGVIYAHQLHVTIGRCVADLELIAKVSDPSEWVNRVEFLPLK
jgi:predicted nucleic acid-binding protein